MITVIINHQPYLDNSFNTYAIDGDDRDESICFAIDQYIEDTADKRVIRSIVCDGVLLTHEETEAKVLEVAPIRYWNSIKEVFGKHLPPQTQ